MNAELAAPTSLFLNRELSWLAFNERVLEEARDPTVPLLERVKFVAIAASNLDEFFMIRVAGLERAVDEGDATADLSGLSPSEQLRQVLERAQQQMASLSHEWTAISRELASHGITIRAWQDCSPAAQTRLSAFFRESVLPVLTPLAIDASRPFPLIASLTLNLALLLRPAAEDPDARLAIVQVPVGLTRLVPVPEGGALTFVLLEDVIRAHIGQLFPGQDILETTCIRISRDAELELDDEGGRTQLEVVEHELRQRRRGHVVRLEIETSASAAMTSRLRRQLEVEEEDVVLVPPPLDLRVLMGLADVPGLDELRNPAHEPAVMSEYAENLFSLIDERDILLHHPYQGYGPVLALIAQAADDPDVLAIKQTLYRVSSSSPFIASLQRAAERNKQVTVLVEVTARFDEERNIQWARALEAAGAHVIYGVRGYKTHAKLLLIVRRSPQGLRRYVHLGTGNYNERTARLYTDFGLMTSSPQICEDVAAVFNTITGYSDPPHLKKLVMAPTDLRRRFLRLIDRERRRAEGGQPAEIMAKMNSLIDREIIEALIEASKAGVTIRLNVRGVCAFRPGVPGATERIEVVSIVDRFLEHSRMYYFLNGGAEEIYLASADWMTRNLDRRIEIMFPIESPALKRTAIDVLRTMFLDNVKARRLGSDGVYSRPERANGEPPLRVQEHLQREAHGAGTAREGKGVRLQPREKA